MDCRDFGRGRPAVHADVDSVAHGVALIEVPPPDHGAAAVTLRQAAFAFGEDVPDGLMTQL